MKHRIITMIAAICMFGSAAFAISGCSEHQTKLTNHMTQKELDETAETEFQLLDKPWEQYMSVPESDYDYLKDKVYIGTEYGALVYGTPCFAEMLPADYDGGAGEIVFLYFSASTSETTEHLITFDSYDDLKAKLRAEYDAEIKEGYQSVPADEDYNIQSPFIILLTSAKWSDVRAG